MSRLKELKARRRRLLQRCDAQRDELAARLGDLTPGALLRSAVDGSAIARLRHPLAWAAALGGLLLLGRPRELLTFVLWIRSAVSLAGRAAQLVRLFAQPRAPRAGH
jgi:hypothetical protein